MALNHPNIVRCSEAYTYQNKLCIVMDYCSEGQLHAPWEHETAIPSSSNVHRHISHLSNREKDTSDSTPHLVV